MSIQSNNPKVQNMKDASAAIVIVDGDNTLWDTNAVFENAQLNMLHCLNNENINIDPKSEFLTLREFDEVLVEHYNSHEYDFSVLALALYLHFKGAKRDEATSRACKAFESKLGIEGINLAMKCGNIFDKDLRKYPPLFKDVKETLKVLKQHGCVIILSSEGNKERVKGIIKYYSMEEYFDHFLNGRKSVEQFEEAKNIGISIWRIRHPGDETIPNLMVIGDLLDRDILFGNRIGAITVYKPGGYKNHQTARERDEMPTYKIKEMHEVINVLLKSVQKFSHIME